MPRDADFTVLVGEYLSLPDGPTVWSGRAVNPGLGRVVEDHVEDSARTKHLSVDGVVVPTPSTVFALSHCSPDSRWRMTL